jgi:hypothetical protein
MVEEKRKRRESKMSKKEVPLCSEWRERES